MRVLPFHLHLIIGQQSLGEGDSFLDDKGEKIKSGFVLVCSGYYNKNTVNIVAYKKNKIYFSQFWRVGSSRSRACFLIHRFSHMVEGTRGILGISFIKVPIPFVSSLLLYSDHCRNKPPPSTIHSGD